MERTIKELHEEIVNKLTVVNGEMMLGMKGNKSAAKRSRKISIELAELFREWRKRSITELPDKE
jgi:hypothetical protein